MCFQSLNWKIDTTAMVQEYYSTARSRFSSVARLVVSPAAAAAHAYSGIQRSTSDESVFGVVDWKDTIHPVSSQFPVSYDSTTGLPLYPSLFPLPPSLSQSIPFNQQARAPPTSPALASQRRAPAAGIWRRALSSSLAHRSDLILTYSY